MTIKNEIQNEAALARFRYLDGLQFCNLSKKEQAEWLKLIDDIYDFEEKQYPMGKTDATRSDT